MSNETRTGSYGTVSDLGVGVLMLDTHFRRRRGDVGNALTWSFPVQFKIVREARPENVVEGGAEGLLEPFIDAARELVDLGVSGITTSCGFLAVFQQQLAAALPVPVATSSLLQIPLIEAMLPKGKRAGILTFSAESLGARHLRSVGAREDTPIGGLPADSLFRLFYGDKPAVADFDTFEAEAVTAALRLVEKHPDIGAIVCECTNLPPHSSAIAGATGLPVFDIVGFIEWFAKGLRPTAFVQTDDSGPSGRRRHAGE
ncbi:aspartate/glutamate racemase family protein [Mesorhizobium sp. M0751]|uniref:aspartate/glutamate racemase family protein n=1 Tax=unclassified Mesorhizobium TaxID=325217 RepID=UPI0033375AE9